MLDKLLSSKVFAILMGTASLFLIAFIIFTGAYLALTYELGRIIASCILTVLVILALLVIGLRG